MSGVRKSKRLLDKDVFDLGNLELSAAAKREEKKIKDDEAKFPITDEQWVVFFYEYFNFIENNIGECLSEIPALHNVSISDLYKVGIDGGGFDNAFDNGDTNFNIGLYYSLLTQFRDGTNKINGCHKINLLLSYVGKALLRMAGIYNSKSANDLIAFFRKIVVILELSVFQEVFLYYMTGDSTGHKHTIDFKHRHNEATHKWYIGIWLRKQEYLGVVTSKGKNFRIKYDNGLRLFVRNYLNRVITYMRTYSSNYPLGYEKPYDYSANIKRVLRDPLPYKGEYKFNERMHYYYISKDDWDCIPNFLLPEDAKWISFAKNFKHPSKWRNPPEQWWIDRIEDEEGLLGGFAWWKSGTDVEEEFKKKLTGTKNLAKWLAINGTLPEQYELHSKLWDADNKDFEEAGAKPAKYAKVSTSAKVAKSAKSAKGGGTSMTKQKDASLPPSDKTKKIFKIVPDKDIALDPQIKKKLKRRLELYLELYFDYNADICTNSNAEYDLIDDVYTNKLNRTILYLTAEKKPHKAATSIPKKPLSPSKMRVARAATR